MFAFGKTVVLMGAAVIFVGLIIMIAAKLNINLGSLPGDVTYHKKNLTIFAPFGTMLIVSVILTVVLNIISKWKN